MEFGHNQEERQTLEPLQFFSKREEINVKSEIDSAKGNEVRLWVPTCASLCFLTGEVSISPGLGEVCSF